MYNDFKKVVARPEGVHNSFVDKPLDSLTAQEPARETAAAPTMRANHFGWRKRRAAVPTIADRINADIAAKGLEEDAAPGEQVYFIGPATGPVKIGRSVSVQARLAGLQTASPLKLEILAVVDGGRLLEKFYHCHFAESRLHGEWFDLTDEMLREIKRHAW